MLRFLASFVFLWLLANAALADAIDGSWCSATGGHIAIDGPQITTNSKAVVQGQYRRHEFLYKVPAGEPDADKFIYMQLLGEEDMQSFIINNDNTPGAQQDWKRCAVTS